MKKKLEDYLSGSFPPSPAYDYVLSKKRQSYNEFIAKFESMTLEELQTWDVLYSFMHYSIMSHLNIMFKNNTFKTASPYCLLGTHSMPIKRKIFEGEVLTMTHERVMHMLVKNFVKKHPEDVPYAPEWCTPLVNAGQYCAEEITRNFPFSPKQIGLELGIYVDDISKIFIAIPDIEDNKSVITKAMSFFGYFLLEDVYNEHRSKAYGTPWHVLTFSPKFQRYVTEQIFKNNKFLYHISPSKFEHKILKQGIVPLSKNERFSYPNRVYLIQEYVDTKHTFLDKFDYVKEAIKAAEMLTKGKILIRDKFVDEYEFTVYRIDVTKLSKNTQFSYDLEYEPLGIFTTNNIAPAALEVVGHFNLNPKQPIKRIVEL